MKGTITLLKCDIKNIARTLYNINVGCSVKCYCLSSDMFAMSCYLFQSGMSTFADAICAHLESDVVCLSGYCNCESKNVRPNVYTSLK